MLTFEDWVRIAVVVAAVTVVGHAWHWWLIGVWQRRFVRTNEVRWQALVDVVERELADTGKRIEAVESKLDTESS